MLPYPLILDKSSRDRLGINIESSVIIFDEAHNIPKNVTATYSSSIPSFSKYALIISKQLKNLELATSVRLLKSHYKEMSSVFLRISQYTQPLEISHAKQFVAESNCENTNFLQLFTMCDADNICLKFKKMQVNELVVKAFLEFLRFFLFLSYCSEDGKVYIERNTRLCFLALNPYPFFSDIMEKSKAVLFASGTLSPFDHFEKMMFGANFAEKKILRYAASKVVEKAHFRCFRVSQHNSKEFKFVFGNKSDEIMVCTIAHLH